eukprot:Blabericola_migrator_1__9498@NODE_515_length_7927_cov_137_886768_g394_i0_p1_GENE_NODE_515_length_7927_cov_137_886768_g394_i0NODE_515_length_7927_cov_137_886768_g394_i0_p1_ORF_typecomplete_len1479_score369_07S1/PF00575_23/0_85S1/PF00575_23/3_1e02S1/PF00575_23/7e02S1/PF00575_23/0_75S1/PF00575_23/7_8e03S1/PF00575_23/0_051S1/PF00575_23/81S1/PF00575_23/1_9e08Suf/PF05843_14/1_2e04Suf/PF05843_14/3_9e07Suf/PF05843_14/4_4e02Suf/PF05843_14/2e12Adaptin_binding/PF10199_9/1e04Adaptin_binding/PF10199_9/0_0001
MGFQRTPGVTLARVQRGALPKPPIVESRKRKTTDVVSTDVKKPAAKKLKGKSKGDDKRKRVEEEEAAEDRAAVAHRIRTFPTKLEIGASVLGIISRITKHSLILDCLCSLQGFVRMSDPAELAMYKVGDYMAAVVCKPTETKMKNEKFMTQLSIAPALFNHQFTWAEPPKRNQTISLIITSVEDHGLAASMDVPLTNTDGAKVWVPLEKGTTAAAAHYREGQVILAVVDEIKKASKLIVCKTGEDMSSRYLSFTATPNVTTIRAGQLLECRVRSVLEYKDQSASLASLLPRLGKAKLIECLPATTLSGLEMSCCQTLSALVPRDHVHHPLLLTGGKPFPYIEGKNAAQSKDLEKAASSWPKRYTEVQTNFTCLGRVAATAPSSETGTTLYVTLLEHNVWLRPQRRLVGLMQQASKGFVSDEMRVLQTHKVLGARFLVPVPVGDLELSRTPLPPATEERELTDKSMLDWKVDLNSCVVAWCPTSKIASELPEFKLSQLSIGQKMKGKVRNTNFFDGTVTVYTDPDYVESIVSAHDLKVGTLVKGEIMERKDWGITVKLSERVIAKADTEMLSDIPSEKIATKFIPGATGKFRVLAIDPIHDTAFLTCKRTLVDIDQEELDLHLTPLDDMSPAVINKVFHVYVSGSHASGLLVRGFGNFFGSLPFDSIRDYLSQPSATEDDILHSPKYRKGMSLRLRLSRILDDGKTKRLQFCHNLDKEDPQSLTRRGGAIPKLTDVVNMPIDRRLSPSSVLPFEFSNEEDVETVARRALEFFPVGTEILGRVIYKCDQGHFMTVAIYGQLRVWVHATELMDKPKGFPLAAFNKGDIVSVAIKGMLHEKRAMLNPLVVLEGTMRVGAAPLPQSFDDLDLSKPYAGIIQHVTEMGIFVHLSPTVVIRIPRRYMYKKGVDIISILHDYGKLAELFPAGKALRKINLVHLSISNRRCLGSLKPVIHNPNVKVTFDNIQVGDIKPAIVKRFETFGLFITFEDSDKLDALCPLDEISDEGRGNIPGLQPGDAVLAKVLVKDEKKRRITAGLKASYFEGIELDDTLLSGGTMIEEPKAPSSSSEASDESDASDEGEEEESQEEESSPEHASDEESTHQGSANSSNEIETLDEDDMEEQTGGLTFDPALLTTKDVVDPLQLLLKEQRTMGTQGLFSDTKAEDDAMEEIAIEHKIRETERSNAEGRWQTDPKSVDDFERLLLIRGDESFTWISYMGYHAKLSDIDSARKVALRGVESMSFEQAEERSNIWIAWLNLEANFGTEESLEEVAEKAAQYNDPLRIYNHLLSIYEGKSKWKEADAVLKKMMKKAGEQVEVWGRILSCLYSRDTKIGAPKLKKGQTLSTQDMIAETLQRAQRVLAPKRYLDLLVVAARLEFKFVSNESGRSKFQSLLAEHPKRLDIWNVLLDAHVAFLTSKNNDKSDKEIKTTRDLFKKATAVDFNLHKLKTLYRKWLQFESKFGNANTIKALQESMERLVAS